MTIGTQAIFNERCETEDHFTYFTAISECDEYYRIDIYDRNVFVFDLRNLIQDLVDKVAKQV